MLSLPEDRDCSIKGLVAVNKESIGYVKSILKELKINKYLLKKIKMVRVYLITFTKYMNFL